jgi:hypothetical protein
MTSEDQAISRKLNVLIALALRQLLGDRDFSVVKRRPKGSGDLARYLSAMGLDAPDIAAVLGSSVASVRTLLTPARRK